MTAASILVVHPEHEAGTQIADALREEGHDVVVVPDGERAIDRFIQRSYDLLIVEMLLPGRDGATTVESIRWAPGGGEAALILLGSRGSDRAQLENAGERLRAHAAIAGPMDIPRIRATVTELTRTGNTTRNALSMSELTPANEAWTDATTRPGARPLTGPVVVGAPPARPAPAPLREPTEGDFTVFDDDLTGSWGPGDLPGAELEGADVERHALAGAREADDAADAVPSLLEAGDLDETPFPRLLHLIAGSRQNGALVLASVGDRRRTTTGETPKKVVFFRSGVPRYVQSNLIQECLGQVLARGGHISHAVLEESVERMRRGEGRQGAVLLSMGAVTPHQLRDALEDQLRVKLFDLFAWTAGSYGFQVDIAAPPETVTLEMSLPEIVFKGVVHRIPPQRLLERLSPHLESYVIPEPRELARFGRVELAPEVEQVLHSLDGRVRLREILARAGDRPGTAAQLIYALHCSDAVRFSDSAEYTEALSSDDPRESSSVTMHIATLREELGRLCRLLRAERYQEALGTAAGDRAAAVARADQLRARFQPVTEPGAAPRDLRALAFEVSARLVHAREAMGAAPGERRSPLELAHAAFDGDLPTRDEKSKAKRSLESEPSQADDVFSAAPPWDPETSEVSLPDDAPALDAALDEEFTADSGPVALPQDFAGPMSTIASDQLGPNAAVPPPRLGRPPAPRFGEALERRFEHSDVSATTGPSVAVTTAPDETPSLDSAVTNRDSAETTAPETQDAGPTHETGETFDPRAQRRQQSAGVPHLPRENTEDGKDEMTWDSAPEESFTDGGPTLDEQVDRLYQAERHFRRGERALRRGKAEAAVEAFSRATELCPEEGEFVSHVGYARYQAAHDQDDIARSLHELEQGSLLSPKLDITHLLLARVRADRGEVASARDAYGRALAANPDCVEALEGIRALDP